jgi:ABC-type Na+ efflux pump permease subunit
MLGPILHQEMLLGGRRTRLHVFRWVYAGWLVLQLAYFYLAFLGEDYRAVNNAARSGGESVYNHASAPEVVGARFAEMFVSQQMILLLLLTPPFVAGAVTDEKRRGTLQYLLTTDLEARHIVLGKLLGRLAQVGLVLIAGWPLFALMAGFGGVEPVSVVFLAAGLAGPVFAVAAGTLLASVLCRQTRDAVLAFYLVLVVLGLLVRGVGGPLGYLDPLYVLGPAWGAPGALDVAEAGRRLLVSGLVWLTAGGVCLAAAGARLRPVYLRELAAVRPGKDAWGGGEREPIDDEPVRWRERHVEGIAPNPTLRRVPQWLAITLIAAVATASSLFILYAAISPGASLTDVVRSLMQLNVRKVASLLQEASMGFLVQAIVALLVASLVVGIRCSGTITSEREKQTWEAVLLTPLSAKQIIRGKMWGVMGASYWYLLAYAAPAVTLSVLGGPLAFGYTVLWLAATVLAMYFIGAAGLWASVRSSNSWRSLLQTLVVGYLGGLTLYAITSPLIAMLALVLILVFALIDWLVGTNFASLGLANFNTFLRVFVIAASVGLILFCWLMARFVFLKQAQRWIADTERTRHWHDEPFYRRARGARPRPRVVN